MIVDPFFWLAVATIISTSGFFTVIGVALYLGKRNIDRERKVAPGFVLSVITSFYQPIRFILRKTKRDERLAQRIGVDVFNHLAEDPYSRVTAEGRIVVIPHCLRDLKCPAKTDPIAGLLCVKCNRCGIGPFWEKAEKHGVKTYVVNGSSFVKRVVVHFQPKAVYGVACTRDLFEVMYYVNGRSIPMIGNLLNVDGCVTTDVDWEAAMKKFVIGLPPLPEEIPDAIETPPVVPVPGEHIAEA